MMNKMKMTQLAALFLVCFSLGAAQRVHASATSFPGIEDYGFFTRDVVHNLDFLDVDLFAGHDWNYYSNGLIYGGRSWRLATLDEVLGIWNVADPNAPDSPVLYNPGGSLPAVTELVSLFGITQATTGTYASNSTIGLTATPAFYANSFRVAQIFDTINPQFSDHYNASNYEYADSSYGWLGAYMVADSAPVPVPGAVWLLGSGLLGVFGLRRKKSS